jgi:hypothetical protein
VGVVRCIEERLLLFEFAVWTRQVKPARQLVRIACQALGLIALCWGLWACKGSGGPIDFHGVRLGMSPGDVRARFEPGADGAFASEAGSSVLLQWTPRGRSSVAAAEFQFHNGMLTYLHAEVDNADPVAAGPALWIGPTSVVERKPGSRTTKVLSIARDCPTHADRVKELVARGAH